MFTDHLEEIQGPVADAGATDRSAGKERLLSLDVFRGVTVAAMILVTDPGTYSARYSPLCHSEWDGPTPTDIIFPSFLVAIGLAMTLSFTARMQRGANRASLLAHVLRRAVVLIFLGLLVNGFPDYPLHTIRIPGILQHIALCYLAGSILYLTLYSRQADNDRIRRMIVIAAWTIGVLALYWALLKLVPVPGFGKGRLDSLGNFGGYVDRSVFSVRHLWAYGTTPGYGVTFDPDGLLVALSSLGNLLIGVLAGEWLSTHYARTRKALVLGAAAGSLILLGWALGPWMPLNKKLWTSTFTILSSGYALLAFAVFYCILDVKRWRSWATRWWTGPALVFGTNAILAFAISSVITTSADRLHKAVPQGSPLTLHTWAYLYGFASWLSPINASLAYALVIVLLNLALLYPLYRRRIFLRI
jgi:predicted acyltransferase